MIEKYVDVLTWMGNVSGALVCWWFAIVMLANDTDLLSLIVLLTAGTVCCIAMGCDTVRLQIKYEVFNSRVKKEVVK